MANEERTTFSELLKLEGDNGIRRIAVAYGSSGCFDTMEVIAEREGVSNSCVSKCIRYAFENCLISHQMCQNIVSKAHNAQVRHINKGERMSPSDRYYIGLLQSRMEYIRNMRDERVTKVVAYYINNSSWSASRLATSLGYSARELNLILKVAIVCGIASDTDVKKIIDISIKKRKTFSDREKIKKVLNEYALTRDQYLLIKNRIKHTEELIRTFDDWDNGDITVEELEERKNNLEKELKEIEALL